MKPICDEDPKDTRLTDTHTHTEEIKFSLPYFINNKFRLTTIKRTCSK